MQHNQTGNDYDGWVLVGRDDIPATAAGDNTESTPQEPEQTSLEVVKGTLHTLSEGGIIVGVQITIVASQATEYCVRTANQAFATTPESLKDGLSVATSAVCRTAGAVTPVVVQVLGLRKSPPKVPDNTSG